MGEHGQERMRKEFEKFRYYGKALLDFILGMPCSSVGNPIHHRPESKERNFILDKMHILLYSTVSRLYGPLVKRLRRGPLTAETRVRFPYGS